jgi:tetratricopeptide (TPR) repeat protein
MLENNENFEKALSLHQNNRFIEAEKLYKEIITKDSDNVSSLYFLSLLLLQNSRGSEAIAYLKKILEKKPEGQLLVDSYNLLGEINFNKNDIYTAEKYFIEASNENQFDLIANFNLGKIYLQMKNYDKSIEYSLKALRAESNQTEIYDNLIQAYAQKNNIDGIIDCYLNLLEIDPSNPSYYFDIGTYYFQKGDAQNTLKSYLNAISLRPDFAAAHINLGELYWRAHNLQNAEKHFLKGFEINNKLFEPYLGLGNVYVDMCETRKTIDISQKGLKKFPGHQSLLFNIARAKLLEGNINEGWEYFKYRRTVNEKKELGSYLLDYNGSLEGKKVLVYSDTGMGDSLQCARYLPLLREKGAIIKCKIQQPLVPLLVESGYECEFIPDSVPHKEVAFDYHVNLTSLTYLFKPKNEKIHSSSGYLKANPEKIQKYKEKYFDNDCFKVGISWQGSGISPVHQLNNIKHVKTFVPFTEIENVKVYSFLKGSAEKQLAELPENVEIVNLGETFTDFSDTAAAMENVDLFILADAAYAHLAGALGKPAWVMIPHVPNWRWFTHREDSPWYDSLRLFRQKEPGNWDEVLERIYSELKLKLSQ